MGVARFGGELRFGRGDGAREAIAGTSCLGGRLLGLVSRAGRRATAGTEARRKLFGIGSG